MRIAFYAPLKPADHPTPSGDRRIARLFLDALRRAGHQPFVASRLRSYDGAGDRLHQARLATIARATVARLSRRWREEPDAAPELWLTYHLFYKAPDWLGPAISAALGIPYVIAEASYAPKRAGGSWEIGHRAVAEALRRADAVLGLNPADRDCVLPLLQHPRRWVALSPFLDARRYRARPARPPSSPLGPPRLIAVAMMRAGDKLASYRLLGAALTRLLDLPWSLEIFGDGPARAEVERALAPLGSRVSYQGALDEAAIARALAEADLCVWPALNEAFGMALLEAQASGVAVVAGRSGGVAGIVVSGETGLLVPPGDAASFAAAVRRLILDGETRAAMGAAGRAKVEREHDLPEQRPPDRRGDPGAIGPGARGMTPSVLFYVQHLLGIGHLQRALRIADALVENAVAVTLVSGGAPVALPRNPAIRFVQLSPVGARDARFELVDGAGRPIDDSVREDRRTALAAAFAMAQPDGVIIEGYPFARRAFRFELGPLIEAVRATRPRPRLICSVRDIVVMRDDPRRHRDIAQRVHRDFDAVLVHGDAAFIPFEASFPAAPEIADRVIYTGYVCPPPGAMREPMPGGEIVVSAGGGAAGHALLKAALAARRSGCLAELPWRVITGNNLPETDFAALCADTPANVVIERFCYNFVGLLRGCRVSVSQAGYNTVLEILAAHARAVLVPFAAERETEQLMRAERLAALGAVELVRESELSPGSLAAAIECAAAREPARVAIDTDGAAKSARLIAAMIRPVENPGECLAEPSGEAFVAGASQGIIAR